MHKLYTEHEKAHPQYKKAVLGAAASKASTDYIDLKKEPKAI